MTYLRHIFLGSVISVFLLMTAQAVQAQQQKASLVADSIQYAKTTGVLVARGNVRVYYQDTVLVAQSIRYDQNTNQIEIMGDFTLKQGDQNTVSGRNTVISSDLQNGLILGARALINQQLQIAAQQLDRVDDTYSVFQTVVASTCHVCENNPTPFWQIRAKRVIHDSTQKKLFFEDAVLDFLGLPIFILPSLSIPEPGVLRASGFLVPEFSSSDVIGISAKIPYYIAINDHSDATITPFLSTKGSAIIEGEYRRRTKTGGYILSGAIAVTDQLDFGGVSAFIEGKGAFDLKNDHVLEFGLNLANSVDLAGGEKSFKQNYGYSDDDRLHNFLRVSKTTGNSHFEVGASFTQSFRFKNFDGDVAGTLEEDPNVPLVFPEYYYKKNFYDKAFGGKLGLTAQSVTLLDSSAGQYTRIGGRLDWTRSWTAKSGVIYSGSAQVNANGYIADGKAFGNVVPVVSGEIRYPLQRSVGNITHVIEPIVQLVWSPDEAIGTVNTDLATSDSTTAEFEETNLFSINRFPGFDETEAGTRANVGVRYLMHNPNGWEMSATAGRVFREKNLSQFDPSTSTGLDTVNSDYVGAISVKFPNRIQLSSRLLFDSSLSASKNETKLAFSIQKLDMQIGYVWIEKDTILNNNDRQHEANLAATYRFNEFWNFSADWRQNLNTHSPIEGNFGISYENECAKVRFSLSLEYDETGSIERELGMKVSLAGLGSNSKKVNFTHRCGF